MPYVLSILGLSLVMIGTMLLYMFKDPKFGNGLMLESFDPNRERRGARSGFALVTVGTIIQMIAVVVA